MTKFTIWDPAIGERPANLALTNNFAATTNPGASNDSTQGYQTGSTWINTVGKAVFICLSATAGAASWTETGGQSEPIADVSVAYNASASAVSFTASGAQVSGGSAMVVLDLTGNPAGAANVTLPTVAALVAAMQNPVPGDSFLLRIKNSANSGTWTVVTDTGWTLTGTVTVATATFRDFVVTLTSLTAAVLQNVGAGDSP